LFNSVTGEPIFTASSARDAVFGQERVAMIGSPVTELNNST